jgi:hypothetical protein
MSESGDGSSGKLAVNSVRHINVQLPKLTISVTLEGSERPKRISVD